MLQRDCSGLDSIHIERRGLDFRRLGLECIVCMPSERRRTREKIRGGGTIIAASGIIIIIIRVAVALCQVGSPREERR